MPDNYEIYNAAMKNLAEAAANLGDTFNLLREELETIAIREELSIDSVINSALTN